jgi:hypothetical protein
MLRHISTTIILAAVANAATAATPFQSLPKKGEEGDAIFCGVHGTSVAKANANGLIQWITHGSTKLPLRKTESLDWVWVNEHPTGVYVAYEATDHGSDSSGGGICKYSGPEHKRAWCTQIPAFNVVATISNSASLYVAGIGLAARIDIQTGKYLWKVDGLYKKDHAFNVFRVPVEDGSNVAFYASSGINGSPTKRLVIAMTTGNVISNEATNSATSLPPDLPRNVQGCKE